MIVGKRSLEYGTIKNQKLEAILGTFKEQVVGGDTDLKKPRNDSSTPKHKASQHSCH